MSRTHCTAVATPRSANSRHAELLGISGITRQPERAVDDYLRRTRYLCSPEYRLGMIDALAQRILGTGFLTRYQRGTSQADAHWAGVEHACTVLEEITRKGGI